MTKEPTKTTAVVPIEVPVMPKPKKHTVVRTFKRVPFKGFRETAEALGISPAQLSVRIGYADNAWNDWERVGNMPEVVAWALKGVSQAATTAAPKLWVAYVTSAEQEKVLDTVAKGLGVSHTTL